MKSHLLHCNFRASFCRLAIETVFDSIISFNTAQYIANCNLAWNFIKKNMHMKNGEINFESRTIILIGVIIDDRPPDDQRSE